mmetsp:Transcript_12621/g.30803  ORF Transcript_12621/g.30803 Transcript_12621/m.30803 type:complete len:256 (+) Transcript_12621:191-958(+)
MCSCVQQSELSITTANKEDKKWEDYFSCHMPKHLLFVPAPLCLITTMHISLYLLQCPSIPLISIQNRALPHSIRLLQHITLRHLSLALYRLRLRLCQMPHLTLHLVGYLPLVDILHHLGRAVSLLINGNRALVHEPGGLLRRYPLIHSHLLYLLVHGEFEHVHCHPVAFLGRDRLHQRRQRYGYLGGERGGVGFERFEIGGDFGAEGVYAPSRAHGGIEVGIVGGFGGSDRVEVVFRAALRSQEIPEESSSSSFS